VCSRERCDLSTHASIIECTVESAEVIDGLVDRGDDLIFLGDIRKNNKCLSPELGDL
jgi:hypothetical protein